MVGELSGVPRAVLQTVFGKTLGRRIWQQARCRPQHSMESQALLAGAESVRQAERRRPGGAKASFPPVADAEIVRGMIEYVSRRAGEALGDRARQAKAIGLRIVYADGVLRFDRMHLACPTNAGPEIGAAAMELFRRPEDRNGGVESVELTVTCVETEALRRRADGLEYAMAGALGERAQEAEGAPG
jgi:hypothetical protein